MKEIINTIITSATAIYVGFITGLILDTNILDNPYLIGNKHKPTYHNTDISEKDWISNRIIRTITGRIPEIQNRPVPNRCDLDDTKGCGGCVSG